MQELFLRWLDERTGIPTLCGKIGSWSVSDSRCYCRFLPTMILFAFVLQVITGIFLWIFYSPGAQTAWESLFYIQFILPGGWMVRGIHHFSAQLLSALLGFYLLTLVFSGHYRSPREFVFWSAFMLLLFTLASSLTGDLLSWTQSGFSATLVRVRFLQMLPWIGEPLFRIIAGGPEFGTLTIPRFLVLHILVFGGGFCVVAIFWRFFEYRAEMVICPDRKKNTEVPFWSSEVLRRSLACLLIMAVVLFLIYRKPILHTIRPDTFTINEHLPKEALRGVHVGAPADPAESYNAARPEWTFRALYHFSHLKKSNGEDFFPGEKKYIPIFIISGGLILYFFLIPLIGRIKIGHYFNFTAVLLLFLALCYLTYASYRHDYFDPEMESFRIDEAKAEALAERTIELCRSPDGIPSDGALTLVRRDPFLQGPPLYKQHCATCHPFSPLEGDQEHPDFVPIACESVKAPNLYQPIRKKWISGFLDAKRLRSDDYFGKTKFVNGAMVTYLRGQLKEIIEEDEEENEKLLDELIALLHEEARRDGPRIETPHGVEGLTEKQLALFPNFNCGQCHMTYAPSSKPVIQAPDLRGYMSRDWMIGIIADPETSRFYGPPSGTDKGNDGMPAFHRTIDDAIMTMQEIETLVDWLRGNWYRYTKPMSAEIPVKDENKPVQVEEQKFQQEEK